MRADNFFARMPFFIAKIAQKNILPTKINNLHVAVLDHQIVAFQIVVHKTHLVQDHNTVNQLLGQNKNDGYL